MSNLNSQILSAGVKLHRNQYVIGEVIGQGGFGITYKAYDSILENPIAIKEFFPIGFVQRHSDGLKVLPIGAQGREFHQYALERYIMEARSLAKYNNHTGVVSVLNYFHENNTAYMIMEYLSGQSLDEWLSSMGGMVQWDEAILKLNSVMETLKDLHQTSFIHRDISPDNIFLCDDGTVKLIDFGAARIAFEGHSNDMSIILKHGYAPLEQYSRKGNQGPWTDVYALAATLFRMVSGETLPESAGRIINDEVPALIRKCPTISPSKGEVLLNALAIKTESRYPDIASFHKALRNAELGNQDYTKRILNLLGIEVKEQKIKWDENGLYSGSTKDGKPCGKGSITWSNGDRYFGEVKDGKLNGEGTYIGSNGEQFTGHFKNSMKHGQGTYIWENGAKYVGEHKDGQMNGKGTYTWPDGSKYVGNFKNGMKNGKGQYFGQNGLTYVGEYLNDKYNGKGKETLPNGSTYIGQFKDNVWNGQGSLTFSDGSVYTGEYKEGKLNGKGTYLFAQKLSGRSYGTVLLKYVGYFKDGLMHGQGTLIMLNAKKYVGEFKNGKMDGYGREYEINGKLIREGLWFDNYFVGKRIN